MKEIKRDEKVSFKRLVGEKVILEVSGIEFSVPVNSLKRFDEKYFLFKNFESHFYLRQVEIERSFLKK